MMQETARAKVNLTLRVLGRRGDGYHALESLVTFADFGDVVRLDVGASSAPPHVISASGRFAAGIDGENLLSRVLASVARRAPYLKLGAVHLEKRLPVAAGLGGGSSDAAALIRLIQRANADHADASFAASQDLSQNLWQDLAASLGADVPVCLAGEPTLMWGVGEKLIAMPRSGVTMPAMAAVLVNPGVPLATRDVFQALGAPPLAQEPAAPVTGGFSCVAQVTAYMRDVGNDLEAPATALLPSIVDVKAALAAQAGCSHVALSGSGPTCFAVFETSAQATEAAVVIGRREPSWWCVATALQFPG